MKEEKQIKPEVVEEVISENTKKEVKIPVEDQQISYEAKPAYEDLEREINTLNSTLNRVINENNDLRNQLVRLSNLYNTTVELYIQGK